MKTKKHSFLLPTLLFFCLTLGALLLLLFPTPHFSQTENRYLATFPSLPTAIQQDTLAKGIEDYCTERFPLRKIGRGIRATMEFLFGKQEIGGVVLCRDGSLSARPTPSNTILQTNLKAIVALKKACTASATPFTVAVVPQRIVARREVLPPLYQSKIDLAPYKAVANTLPSTLFLLENAREEEWFRTDHHWSVAGAYTAYVALGEALGYTPYPESAFEKEVVSRCFYGSADAAAGLPFTTPDAITLWRYEGDEDTVIRRDGAPEERGFYRMEKLSTRDGYGVFLGGNYVSLTVTLGEADTRPLLLIYKDSFANALIPFLARHFRLHVIDPRYGTQDHAALLRSADRVLVLAGMLSLCEAGLF